MLFRRTTQTLCMSLGHSSERFGRPPKNPNHKNLKNNEEHWSIDCFDRKHCQNMFPTWVHGHLTLPHRPHPGDMITVLLGVSSRFRWLRNSSKGRPRTQATQATKRIVKLTSAKGRTAEAPKKNRKRLLFLAVKDVEGETMDKKIWINGWLWIVDIQSMASNLGNPLICTVPVRYQDFPTNSSCQRRLQPHEYHLQFHNYPLIVLNWALSWLHGRACQNAQMPPFLASLTSWRSTIRELPELVKRNC